MKLSISQSDAEISIAQEKVNTEQAEIDNLKNSELSVSRNVLAGLSHNLKNSTEVLGYRKLDKEFKEYSLQITDSYYLAVESELKTKIIEISGGDESLLAIHVPPRPSDLSLRFITGAGQVAIDARMKERMIFMNNRRFTSD